MMRAEANWQHCNTCGTTRAGDRAAVRNLYGWEPYSYRTQKLIEEGPMICRDCMLNTLNGTLHSMRAAVLRRAAAAPTEKPTT